jgi:ferredoxin
VFYGIEEARGDMETELYYFSGTGNSLFVARELRKLIPDCGLIPIAGQLRGPSQRTTGKVAGFVFPVHALSIPIAVRKFVRKLDIDSADYIFAVATRHGTVFRGFQTLERLLRRKGKRLASQFVLNMCNNDSRHGRYHVPDRAEISTIEAEVLSRFTLIRDTVLARAESREADSGVLFPSHKNRAIGYLIEKMVVMLMALSEHLGGVNYFYVDASCNGCRVCEQVCLSTKVRLVDGKPFWRRDTLCYMCFACLNFCPRAAVQIHSIPGVKSFTLENGRYPHPYATIADIAAQKGVI